MSGFSCSVGFYRKANGCLVRINEEIANERAYVQRARTVRLSAAIFRAEKYFLRSLPSIYPRHTATDNLIPFSKAGPPSENKPMNNIWRDRRLTHPVQHIRPDPNPNPNPNPDLNPNPNHNPNVTASTTARVSPRNVALHAPNCFRTLAFASSRCPLSSSISRDESASRFAYAPERMSSPAAAEA